MALDMYAVGTALAGQFATVTAPAGTMGGTAIRSATVESPNNLVVYPAIHVELPSGEVITDSAQQRATHEFPVYFLFAPVSGDQPRDKKAMLQWLGPLLNATHSAVKLGASAQGVMKALVLEYEPVIYDYGGTNYWAWRLPTAVWTEQTITLTP